MHKSKSLVLVAVLLVTSFGAVSPSFAEGAGGEGAGPSIGKYKKLGLTHPLDSEHIAVEGSGLRIEGPTLTSELRIRLDYLAAEIGAWATDSEFTIHSEEARFSHKEARFFPLVIGEIPVYTFGDESQLLFSERPMWVSAHQGAPGSTLTLTLEDGDSTGQTLFISRDWLWARGIHRPDATHEDGFEIVVYEAEGGIGWFLDVPHFSDIVINPPNLDVRGKQNGLVLPHDGQRRWNSTAESLEIDVGQKSSTFELMVDKSWVDFNLVNPALHARTWSIQSWLGKSYYVTSIPAADTPTTIVYENFSLREHAVFTKGSPDTLALSVALRILAAEGLNNTFSFEVLEAPPSTLAVFNVEWLEAMSMGSPWIFTASEPDLSYELIAHHLRLPLPSGTNTFHLVGGVGQMIGKCVAAWAQSCHDDLKVEIRDFCVLYTCPTEVAQELDLFLDCDVVCDTFAVMNTLHQQHDIIIDLCSTICEDQLNALLSARDAIWGTEFRDSGLPAADSYTRLTDDASGDWYLTLTANVPGTTPVGDFLSVSLPPIPDYGEIRQHARYLGTNPWYPADLLANDPPPGESTITATALTCVFWATVFIVSGVAGALGVAAGAFLAFVACMGLLALMCADQGRWGASGMYVNSWGNKESGDPLSRWRGGFDLPLGILSLTTEIYLHHPRNQPHSEYETPDPYKGYHEQQAVYRQQDAQGRETAYALFSTWGVQLSSASAQIVLEIPLLQRVLDDPLPALTLGLSELGYIYYVPVLNEILIGCGSCAETVILTITSSGEATIAPAGPGEVTLDFTGEPGGADITILGIPFEGHTLNGNFGGREGGSHS